MNTQQREILKEYYFNANATYTDVTKYRKYWIWLLARVDDLGLHESLLNSEEQFKTTLVEHRLYTRPFGPTYSEVEWVHAGWQSFCATMAVPSCPVIGAVAALYLSTIVDEVKRQAAANELERFRHVSAQYFTWAKMQTTVYLSKDMPLYKIEFAQFHDLAKTPLAEWQSVRDIQIPDIVYCDKSTMQSD